ncbi:MAG: hypothetical protein Q9171_003714 [Xanthocarpia ochracea]
MNNRRNSRFQSNAAAGRGRVTANVGSTASIPARDIVAHQWQSPSTGNKGNEPPPFGRGHGDSRYETPGTKSNKSSAWQAQQLSRPQQYQPSNRIQPQSTNNNVQHLSPARPQLQEPKGRQGNSSYHHSNGPHPGYPRRGNGYRGQQSPHASGKQHGSRGQAVYPNQTAPLSGVEHMNASKQVPQQQNSRATPLWLRNNLPRTGPCPSPLEDVDPLVAMTIAELYYKGPQADIWGGPPIPDTIDELEGDKLEEALRAEEHHLASQKVFNRTWSYDENTLWLNGGGDQSNTSTVKQAPEKCLIRIPFRSDIPVIPDIPQNEASQQTAWILLIGYLYPTADDEDVTAVFNRIWNGPRIIFNMAVRVRVEVPSGQAQVSTQDMRDIRINQKLWKPEEQNQRMARFGMHARFLCRFPGLMQDKKPYAWNADSGAVRRTIDRAAQRLYVDLSGNAYREEREAFWANNSAASRVW